MKKLRVASLFVLFLASSALAQTNPVPIVYQPLLPMTVKPGSKGFPLTVNGTGFAADALVVWNGSTRITNFISNTQLQIQVTAADVAHAGTATVGVTNPAPGGGTSNLVFFPVQTPATSLAVAAVSGLSGLGTGVAGDFNNDGFLDLVVRGNLLVNFYAGNGDGTFAAPVPKLSVVPVSSMLAADFNADGKLDLAFLDGIGNTVVFLNESVKGLFVQQQVFRSFNDGLATADLNGDGKLDLIVTGPRSAIHLGNGDGTFGGPLFLGGGGGYFSGTPAVGDFNRDGKLDLAIPDTRHKVVLVFLGNGDGTFGSDVQYPVQFGYGSLATADFNGDGKLDLVTDAGEVLLGNGDGTFTDIGGVSSGGSGPIQIGDFNGDGKLDIAVSGIQVLLGNGDGTFQNPIQIASDGLWGIGDFNGDGKLDFAGGSVYLQVPLIFSPRSLDFGTQKVGTQSPPQTVTATNDGSSPLTITNIGFSGSDPQDFSQMNDCGSTIFVGAQCNIKIVFQPQAGGTRSASLSVSYQGFGSPQGVPITGFGAVATVTLAPSKLTFPLQLVGTTSSAQPATLTNTGTVSVNISKISTTVQFSQTNNCPSSLPVSGNCQIQVQFAPEQKGQIAGTLSVTDDAQGSPQTVMLSGAATEVKLSTVGVNFGDQKVGTKSRPAPVTVTNVGKSSFIIHQISFKGANAADFSQTNNCGSKIQAGASCTIKVVFAPKAKGARSASLQISDTGGGSPQKVALSGTGT
jgi:FG-GAP-like repeat/Abnormal spindle-like microcephaly-assoc'd, ASPM-SPD-2-Hydin